MQANSAADYLAVGIDASWLLINGLDAACMRRFRDCISLSDWVTKLGLEQSIARKIGLSGEDFISLGWDYQSLMAVCVHMCVCVCVCVCPCALSEGFPTERLFCLLTRVARCSL